MSVYHKLIVILVIVVLTLSGCKNRIDLEDRNYVMALGIDLEDGQLKASYGFPDLYALTGKGESIHYPVVTIKGNNLEEIGNKYGNQSNKRLDYGQLQVIILGQDLLKDPDKMRQVLNYLKINQEFSRTVYVCVAADDAESIIALDESVNGSIGNYIKDMIENNFMKLGSKKVTSGDFIIGLSNPDREFSVSILKENKSEKIPILEGSKVIKGISLKKE